MNLPGIHGPVNVSNPYQRNQTCELTKHCRCTGDETSSFGSYTKRGPKHEVQHMQGPLDECVIGLTNARPSPGHKPSMASLTAMAQQKLPFVWTSCTLNQTCALNHSTHWTSSVLKQLFDLFNLVSYHITCSVSLFVSISSPPLATCGVTSLNLDTVLTIS
jgi:hypothetical protein